MKIKRINCLILLLTIFVSAAFSQVVFSNAKPLMGKQYLPYDSLTNMSPMTYKYNPSDYSYLIGQEMYYLGLNANQELFSFGDNIQIKENGEWVKYPQEEVIQKPLLLVAYSEFNNFYFVSPELPDTLYISTRRPDEDFVVKGHLEKATSLLVGKELIFKSKINTRLLVNFRDVETHRDWSEVKKKEGKEIRISDGSIWKCTGIVIDTVDYMESAFDFGGKYDEPYSASDNPMECRVTLVLENSQYGKALYNLSHAETLYEKYNGNNNGWLPFLRLKQP